MKQLEKKPIDLPYIVNEIYNDISLELALK